LSSFFGGFAGSALGRVAVEVGLDTRPLDTSLAKTEAQLKGSSTGMANTMKTALTVGAGLAAVAVVKFGADSVRAFEEAQRVAAQTAAVIKSTGGAAGVTAQQVEDLAKHFQSLTTFSDEEVQSAENLILTFRHISGDIFPQTTQAVLDMSTALGQDLKSSAIQLGKALDNPLIGMTALRRVGVSFSEQQVELIKHFAETNQLAKAQKLILEEVAKEFGGSATAAAKTFSGQMQQLANQFDDFKEVVGAALVSTLNVLLPVFSKGIELATKYIGALAGIAAALGAMFIARALTGLLLALSSAVIELGTAGAAAAVGMNVAAGALATLGAAMPVIIPGLALIGYKMQEDSELARRNAEAVRGWAVALAQGKLSVEDLQAAIDRAPAFAQGQLQDMFDQATQQAKALSDAFALVRNRTKEAQVVFEEVTPVLDQMGISAHDFGQQAAEAAQQGKEAFQKFADDAIAKTVDALQKWRDGAAESLNFVAGALDNFAGKTDFYAHRVLVSFDKQLAAQREFGADLQTILKRSHGQAQGLTEALLNMGDQGVGVAHALATANDQTFNQIVGDFAKGEHASESLATKLQHQLIGALSDIRDILSAIAKKWGVQVELHDGASSGLSKIELALRGLVAHPWDVHITYSSSGTGTTKFGGKGLHHSGGPVMGGDGSDVPIIAQDGEFVINRRSAQRIGLATLLRLNSFHHGGMVRDLQTIKDGGLSFFWKLPRGVNPEDARTLYEQQAKQAGTFFSAYGSTQSALQSLVEASDVGGLRKVSDRMHAWLSRSGLGVAGFRDDAVWNALNLIEYAIKHKGNLPGAGADKDKLAGFIAGFFSDAAQKKAGVHGLGPSAYAGAGGGDAGGGGGGAGTGGGGGTGGNTINVYGDVYGYEDFASKVGDAMTSMVMRSA
jgi:hypothetical protein